MNKAWAILLSVVLFFVGTSLQGCGCKEDDAKKCFEEKVKELASKSTDKDAGCKALEAIVKCITDNDCCDLESDGKKMKDAVQAIIDSSGKALGCTIENGCK